MNKLEEEIEEHRDLYYNGQPKISDDKFDALVDQLRKDKPNSPVLSKIGFSPEDNGWDKKRHYMEMSSLNKVNSYDELKRWEGEVGEGEGFFMTEKMDGISIELRYEDGFLQEAITRGDGEVGEDIYQNVVTMQNIPYQIKCKGDISYRGEIVLEKEKWKKHFSSYSNPRNAASGVSRVEDREKAEEKCKHLSVYVYNCSKDFDTQKQKIEYIEDEFKAPNKMHMESIEEAEEVYEFYESGFREELPYDIDGLVIKLNNTEKLKGAGEKNNRPFGAMALKFASEKAVSKLHKIEWQVGSSGRITPVAIMDKVELAGAEVRRASLYNWAYVESLNLTIGDRVVVERVNDVIPRITHSFEDGHEAEVLPPMFCPSCKGPVEKDGEYLVCAGHNCGAKQLGDFQRWIESLDLMGIGDSILQMILRLNLVNDIADLYLIKPDQIKDLKNDNDAILGEKRAKEIIAELHLNKDPLMSDFLGGLNIKGLRSKTAQKIVDYYDNHSVKEIVDLNWTDLREVEGIGDKTGKNISNGLDQKSDLINKLLSEADIKPERATGDALGGMAFAVTGKLSKRRSEVHSDIREAGGEVKSGVSKSLDFLVTNNPNSTSNKLKKARKYGTNIISEKELYEKCT